MSDLPVFVLSVAPQEPTLFPNFFGKGGPVALLERPGELRYAGWDMTTGDQARIVRGEYLEVGSTDWKLLQLYEDGTFIARVPGDEKFLAWAATGRRPFREHPKLNPLALIEFIYAFAHLYGRLLSQLKPEARKVRWRADFRHLVSGDSRVYLVPHGLDTFSWVTERTKYFAPDSRMELEKEVEATDFRLRPDRTGYLIVERIYAWFGAASDVIPYVAGTDSDRVIDVETIKSGGKQKS